MNESSNPSNPDQTQNEPNASQTADSQSEPKHSSFESFRSALHSGAQQAKSAAEAAAPKIKAAISDATYWIGFGTSFAAVFSYVLAKELAFDTLTEGFQDGAARGKAAAERFASDWTTRKESASAASTSTSGLTPPAPEAAPV